MLTTLSVKSTQDVNGFQRKRYSRKKVVLMIIKSDWRGPLQKNMKTVRM